MDKIRCQCGTAIRDGKFYWTNVCGVLKSDKVEASKAGAEVLNNCCNEICKIMLVILKAMNNVMADIQITIPTSRETKENFIIFSQFDHPLSLSSPAKNFIWI